MGLWGTATLIVQNLLKKKISFHSPAMCSIFSHCLLGFKFLSLSPLALYHVLYIYDWAMHFVQVFLSIIIVTSLPELMTDSLSPYYNRLLLSQIQSCRVFTICYMQDRNSMICNLQRNVKLTAYNWTALEYSIILVNFCIDCVTSSIIFNPNSSRTQIACNSSLEACLLQSISKNTGLEGQTWWLV